jgi:hypothetical protein
MRRTLAVTLALGMLVAGASAADAAGSKGSNGSNSSSKKGGTVKVGPNGKLADNGHTIQVAVKFTCKNGKKTGVAAKVKQGDTVGKGTTSVQCKKGETKTVVVDVKSDGGAFSTGDARACAATAKNEKHGSPTKCRDIDVVS